MRNSSVYGGHTASKVQPIGGAIFIVCVVVAIIYAAMIYAVMLFYPQWLSVLGVNANSVTVQFWTLAIPVFIAFIAVMAIGAWISWTMATTPPTKPIEEIEAKQKAKRKRKRNKFLSDVEYLVGLSAKVNHGCVQKG